MRKETDNRLNFYFKRRKTSRWIDGGNSNDLVYNVREIILITLNNYIFDNIFFVNETTSLIGKDRNE